MIISVLIILYIAIGVAVIALFDRFTDWEDESDPGVEAIAFSFIGMFWPIAVIAVTIYGIGIWIASRSRIPPEINQWRGYTKAERIDAYKILKEDGE